MVVAPPGHPLQGIMAMGDGCQLSGVSIQTMNTGTLSATTPIPRRIGDILISYATGKMYIAETAAGSSADWILFAGLATAASFTVAGALSVGTTLTQTGVATFATPPVMSGTVTASPTLFKVFTSGSGAGGTVDFYIGEIPGAGTPPTQLVTPAHKGDIVINPVNGKMYIASAAAATTDWKLVTSA